MKKLVFFFYSLKNFNPTKRHKIVTTSLILGVAFILTTISSNIFYKRYYVIVIFGLISYVLSLWALWEGINKTKMITVLTLPTLFCLGAASFYFVLNPDYIRWLTRAPAAIIFSVLFYLILLSQNVFNVASLRTIPLYRAASTTSLIFTMFTAILTFSVIYTLRLEFYLNSLFVAVLSFILSISILWNVEMGRIKDKIIIYCFAVSLLVGELALALSFWPILPLLWSVSLSIYLYCLLGLLHHYLKDRLTGRLIWEYGTIGFLVLFFLIIVTSWTN